MIGNARMASFARLGAIALAIACATLAPSAAQAQDAPVLPGGASALQETYGAWLFTCQTAEAVRRCAIVQQQVRQGGQRVLSIELQPASDNTATGTLVLPFGLLLDAGITVQVDDQPVGEDLRFHTCGPAGCVVRLTLDAATITALRNGETFTIVGKTADTQQDFPLAVSLNGIAAALDRSAAFL